MLRAPHTVAGLGTSLFFIELTFNGIVPHALGAKKILSFSASHCQQFLKILAFMPERK